MGLHQENPKRLLIYVFWYVGITWILVWMYYLVQGFHATSWQELHQQLLNGATNSSTQFRVLAFWIPELIHRAFQVDIVYAYLINRFIWTLLTLVFFHIFLLKWFDHVRAWLSTMLLSFLLVASYLPLFQESDIILYVFFLAGLFLIRKRSFWWLCVIFFVGTFAKETIVLLLPLYVFVEYKNVKVKQLIIRTACLSAIWLIAFLITRYAFYPGHNSSLWQLPHNLSVYREIFNYPMLLEYRLLWIPLFGILWVVSFFDRDKKPALLRFAGPYGVGIFALVMVIAWPEETRLLVPTAFLAIPSAIFTLQQNHGESLA